MEPTLTKEEIVQEYKQLELIKTTDFDIFLLQKVTHDNELVSVLNHLMK